MRLLKGLLYFVACTFVFVLATSLTIRYLLTDESSVPCPDITGLDVEEAKRIADGAGLSLLVMKYEVKKDIPYNQVLAQNPDAATPVRAGRTVSVVVSDGPRPMEIPQLVGLSLEEAQAEITARGLPLKEVLYVPNENRGKVLAQTPSAGMNIIDEEGMVLITGGRARRYFLMPEISVGNIAPLMQELEKKEIKYAIIPAGPLLPFNATVPRSRILPGTIFGEGSVVELPVSNGG